MVPTSPFWEAGPGLQWRVLWGELGGQAQAGLAGQSCDSWALEEFPSSPLQASSQGPHCPGKSCHCFLPEPPNPGGLPPPQCCRQHPGLELGSVRWEPRLRRLRAPCLPFTTTQTQGGSRELGGSGVPFLAPSSPTNPTPNSFLPLQATGLGERAEAGAGQEAGSGAAGNAGSGGEGGGRGPGLCSIFSGKKTGGKTVDGVPPPRPSGIPLKLGAGSGVPSWLGLRGHS